MRMLGMLVLSGAIGLHASATAQAISADKADIVGLRLGMTEAEVMAALKAFDSRVQVAQKRMARYRYSDGINGLQTPPFLDELEVRAGTSVFRIWFASPPAEPRTYAIHRYSQDDKTAPTQQQFAGALTAKFGPTQSHYLANTGTTVMQWGEKGKPLCAVSSNTRVVVDSSNETLLPPRAVEVLEKLAKGQHANLRQTMGNAMDAGRCGIVVRYAWGGAPNQPAAPVANFHAWLVDQGGMVTKHRQAMKWVESLEAEAVRKRQGVLPKL
jgi:hypothetical protein